MCNWQRKVLCFLGTITAGLIMVSTVSADDSASYVPYDSYIYDYNGNPMIIPHAYIPIRVLDGKALGVGDLYAPSDVRTDTGGNVYIADAGNNRVLFFNANYQKRFILSKFQTPQGEDSFNYPTGLCVAPSGDIYVADTQNSRIVQFDTKGNFIRVIGAPETTLLDEDYIYTPSAVSVDKSGNIYVVATGVNMGVLHFSPEGNFVGFIGAQPVSYNPIDYIWKMFLSKAQRDRMQSFVPTEYNNITLDERGFLYVTTSAIEKEDFIAAVTSRSTSGKGTPVKCLNPTGKDVLVRRGYTPPVGDVGYSIDGLGNVVCSVIEDVALGPNGSYTLMDSRKSRLFTYSASGELLYAFGAKGSQMGNSELPSSITYKGNDLLLLDKQNGTLTIYGRTHYGDLINQANGLYNDFEYEASVKVWESVLDENANFDIAYDGIGNAYMRVEKYKEAMECFGYSNNLSGYSKALREYRNQLIEKYVLLIPVIIIILIFLLAKLFGYINNRIKGEKYQDRQRTVSGNFLYGFHILTHPFDGFWDIKHEKRGSFWGATSILALAIITLIAQKLMTGYLFNSYYLEDISILQETLGYLLPVLLWVSVNWSVTTLMEGKGSVSDIYQATCYAMLPIPLLILPTIPLSYILISEEGMYLSLLISVAYFWTGFLIFCGNLTVHQYSLFKNVVSIVATIIGIGIVIFIVLLIATTYQKLFGFIINLFKEVTYRI